MAIPDAEVIVHRAPGAEVPMLHAIIMVGLRAYRFLKRDDGDPESAWTSTDRGGTIAGIAEIAILDAQPIEGMPR